MFRTNIKKKVLHSKTYQSAKSETKGESYRLEEILHSKPIFVFNTCCSVCMWQSQVIFQQNFEISYPLFSVQYFYTEHWWLPYFFQLYSTAQFKTQFTEGWLMERVFWEIGFWAGREILVIPSMGVLPQGHLWHKLPTGKAQLLLGNPCWISERRTWQCSFLYNH